MGEEICGDTRSIGDLNNCLGLLKSLSKEEILGILCGGEGFCGNCQTRLRIRIQNFVDNKDAKSPESNITSESSEDFWSSSSSTLSSLDQNSKSLTKTLESVHPPRAHTLESAFLGSGGGYSKTSSPATVVSGKPSLSFSPAVSGSNDGLLEDPNEHLRVSKIKRKQDFYYVEKVDGVKTNVLQGLELHTGVFNADEQKKIVDCVYDLQRKGQRGQLRERTYLAPKKWMRGKGRVTIQFGCCYNYAKDKYGNPPGIIRDEEVDPLPPLFKQMIKRMVRWRVLPPTCVPDSCIVNLYNAGDCIPPHIDHHDFLRPFCTVSFLTECDILFGTNLKVVDEGEFDGPVAIPLPVGSVLILNGNGADVAKHCVPGVPAKRISITFRKMDDSKLPYQFVPDPELEGMKPVVHAPSATTSSRLQQNRSVAKSTAHRGTVQVAAKPSAGPVFNKEDDFPPLGGSSSLSKRGNGYERRR